MPDTLQELFFIDAKNIKIDTPQVHKLFLVEYLKFENYWDIHSRPSEKLTKWKKLDIEK